MTCQHVPVARHEDDGEPLTLYLVKRLEQVTKALMDETLRPHGLTTVQYTALTVLRRRGGLSSAQLARRSFVTPQSMHEMVLWLEHRELVHRSRDQTNRRVLLIELTEAGRKLLDECDPLIEDFEGRMLAGMSATERRAFRTALRDGYSALVPLTRKNG